MRKGLAAARDRGYDAAVYLDGDGEYDPADFERVLEPVARGRAEYVVGSRFLGDRDGMTWHRALANRFASALLGADGDGRLATARAATARSPRARSPPRASATTTTTPRC